jgi:hypothetical protein
MCIAAALPKADQSNNAERAHNNTHAAVTFFINVLVLVLVSFLPFHTSQHPAKTVKFGYSRSKLQNFIDRFLDDYAAGRSI